MKDYSMNKEERGNFILSYDIEGNNIIVNFANGSRWTLPYNEKNENIVLEKMRSQVENSEEFCSKEDSKLNRLSKWLRVFGVWFGISTVVLILRIISNAPIIVPSLLEGLMVTGTLATSLSFLKSKFVLDDWKKIETFVK